MKTEYSHRERMTPVSKSVLYDMLMLKRPYGGSGVDTLIERHLTHIEGADSIIQDDFGNIIVGVGGVVTLDSYAHMPKIMFTSHMDTVHREDGTQFITIEDGAAELVSLADKHSNCLGSDDAAGMWVMLNMIAAKVPAVYIFHDGEECGTLGSSFLAKNYPDFIGHFNQCISIDRKDTHSIITEQISGKCCSNEYAWSLAEAIGMGHRPDDTGMLTDSDSYTHLIEECTNLSAGYYNEHTVREHVNVTYLEHLVLNLIGVDFEGLSITRKAGDDGWSSRYYNSYDEYADYAPNDMDVLDKTSLYNRDKQFYIELTYNDPDLASQLLFELMGEL